MAARIPRSAAQARARVADTGGIGTVWDDRFELKELSPLNDSFVATVHESNRQGVDGWVRYAGHRERLTRLLSGMVGNDASLCVLGAGNLNDLHLDRLACADVQVHLVDLDVAAVQTGLGRYRGASMAVQVHGPLDLSGILDRLPAGDGGGDSADALCELLGRHRCAVQGAPFDVTVSAGLLTQLLQSVVESSLKPREVISVSLALRDKHLADLVHLTRPGGTLVLVTDVVSTATAPQLLMAAPADLEKRMAELVASGNFFTGTNPYRIVALLEEDNRFRHFLTGVRLLEPWLWQVVTDRQHLTVAVLARRTRARGGQHPD